MISVGGADHGVFQWRFLPQGVEQEASIEGQENEQPLETTGGNFNQKLKNILDDMLI